MSNRKLNTSGATRRRPRKVLGDPARNVPVEEDPQPFTALRQAPIMRGNDWSNVAPEDDRMKIAVTRILRLKLAGLT